MISVRSYTVTETNITFLANEWSDLEKSSAHSTFLSWDWLCELVISRPDKTIVLEASVRNKIVGLGLLFVITNKFTGERHLHLHRTGNHQYDQLWIEYNDFLLDKDYEIPARNELTQFALKKLQWNTLNIGPSVNVVLANFESYGCDAQVTWSAPAYCAIIKDFVNLDEYLLSLSKNVRGQIKRDLLKSEGILHLDVPSSAHEAAEWFVEAGPAHIRRWQHTDSGSGFENVVFTQLHTSLIKKRFEQNKLTLLRFKYEEDTIAYFYYFIDGRDIKFYLSSINYQRETTCKNLGLLLHARAIQHFIREGADSYDFMAGGAQYKRSMSHQERRLEIIQFSRTTLRGYLRIAQQIFSFANSYMRCRSNSADFDATVLLRQKSPCEPQKQYLPIKLNKLPHQITSSEFIVNQKTDSHSPLSNNSNLYLLPDSTIIKIGNNDNNELLLIGLNYSASPGSYNNWESYNLIASQDNTWSLNTYQRSIICITDKSNPPIELGRKAFGGYILNKLVYLFTICGRVSVLSQTKLFTVHEFYLNQIFKVPNIHCHSIWPIEDFAILCCFSIPHLFDKHQSSVFISLIDIEKKKYKFIKRIKVPKNHVIVGVFS